MSLKDILSNLAKGIYDGKRIDNEENGVSWGLYVDHGTPMKYHEGKSSKFFNGKENERILGKRTVEKFVTDEQKKTFFQKFGHLRNMFGDHQEVMDYSRDYYEKQKKKK